MRKPASQRTTMKTWVVVLVALLDDVAIIGLVFLGLWLFDVDLSWPVIVAIGLVMGTFVFIVHRAIIPSLKRRRITGQEGMVGQTAVVTEPLSPRGTVQVHGEYWKAYCGDGVIEEGTEVEILDVRGLSLEVRRKP